RLSDRSVRRYAVVRCFLRETLQRICLFAMQSEEDARRIVSLGAPAERVRVTGNMKHDAPAADVGAAEEWRRRLGLRPARRGWVAGSTHSGEGEPVLDAHAEARGRDPDLALIVAPRHPERTAEVVTMAARRGPVIRRSEIGGTPPPDAVVILDTIGELASLYAVADVAFVGGSLVPRGGPHRAAP